MLKPSKATSGAFGPIPSLTMLAQLQFRNFRMKLTMHVRMDKRRENPSAPPFFPMMQHSFATSVPCREAARVN